MIDQEFWVGKRVFLTGHTGFKGSWLSLWLIHLGCSVKGYSLNPPTSPSLFDVVKIGTLVDSQIGDIRDQELLNNSMVSFNPDILIHMAAQPLVRRSYDEPIETYEVNVIGTAKVLEAARNCSNLKAIINITTDKCYENVGFDKILKRVKGIGNECKIKLNYTSFVMKVIDQIYDGIPTTKIDEFFNFSWPFTPT
jgi:CDP-glucose 4,6-dehydratase